MSLSSLRSFSTAATTAFDTARSTLKAMADAAVPPGDQETAAAPEPTTTPEPKTEMRRAGIRKGTVLDAYA